MFPELQELGLHISRIDDPNSIIQAFPQLQKLRISFWFQSALPEFVYEQLLRKNPHIESLWIAESSRRIMRITNEIIPDITYLHIRNYNPNNEPGYGQSVVFKHVTNLTYESTGDLDQVPDDVFFEKLTGVSVHVKSHKNWIIFIERNPSLRKLNVLGPVFKDQFERLIKWDRTWSMWKLDPSIEKSAMIEFSGLLEPINTPTRYTFLGVVTATMVSVRSQRFWKTKDLEIHSK